MTVVLDSWPVLRYIEGAHPAAEAIDGLLQAQRPRMSWINAGEVFYVVRRLEGEQAASAVLRDLGDVVAIELPGEERVVDAARIKADYPMAYADAFAAATAMDHDAVLWTGDPELLVEGAPWRWKDLR